MNGFLRAVRERGVSFGRDGGEEEGKKGENERTSRISCCICFKFCTRISRSFSRRRFSEEISWIRASCLSRVWCVWRRVDFVFWRERVFVLFGGAEGVGCCCEGVDGVGLASEIGYIP